MPQTTAAGATPLVRQLVLDSTNPEANKAYVRAAALGVLGATDVPLDQAWLHIVVARTMSEDEIEQAIGHMEKAYDLTLKHDLVGPLAQAGLSLYILYTKNDDRDKANAILRVLGDRAIDGVNNKLANAGTVIGDGFGRMLLKAGAALSIWGQQITARPPAGGNDPTSTKQG